MFTQTWTWSQAMLEIMSVILFLMIIVLKVDICLLWILLIIIWITIINSTSYFKLIIIIDNNIKYFFPGSRNSLVTKDQCLGLTSGILSTQLWCNPSFVKSTPVEVWANEPFATTTLLPASKNGTVQGWVKLSTGNCMKNWTQVSLWKPGHQQTSKGA